MVTVLILSNAAVALASGTLRVCLENGHCRRRKEREF